MIIIKSNPLFVNGQQNNCILIMLRVSNNRTEVREKWIIKKKKKEVREKCNQWKKNAITWFERIRKLKKKKKKIMNEKD